MAPTNQSQDHRQGAQNMYRVSAMLLMFLTAVVGYSPFDVQKQTAAPTFASSGFHRINTVLSTACGGGGFALAFADINNDRFTDVIVASARRDRLCVMLWDHDSFAFVSGSEFNVPHEAGYVANVVVADFTTDGFPDVLLFTRQTPMVGVADKITQMIFVPATGDTEGNFLPSMAVWIGMCTGEATVMDVDNDLIPDLMGTSIEGNTVFWTNSVASASVSASASAGGSSGSSGAGSGSSAPSPGCTLSDVSFDPSVWGSTKSCGFDMSMPLPIAAVYPWHGPMSVDVTGDCLADIVVPVVGGAQGGPRIEVWVNSGRRAGQLCGREDCAGVFFKHEQVLDLPPSAGVATVADIDGDGGLDLLWPLCDSQRIGPGALLGGYCDLTSSIVVQFNALEGSHKSGGGSTTASMCGKTSALFLSESDSNSDSDRDGDGDGKDGGDSMAPIWSDDQSHRDTKLLDSALFVDPFPMLWPLQLRVGDYDLNGHTDIIATAVHTDFGSRHAQATIWESVPCEDESMTSEADTETYKQGCARGRKFQKVTGSAVAPFANNGALDGAAAGSEAMKLPPVVAAAFIDIDSTGTLDVLALTASAALVGTRSGSDLVNVVVGGDNGIDGGASQAHSLDETEVTTADIAMRADATNATTAVPTTPVATTESEASTTTMPGRGTGAGAMQLYFSNVAPDNMFISSYVMTPVNVDQHPFGALVPGASIRMAMLDSDFKQRRFVCSQAFRTSVLALSSPGCHFGLGRASYTVDAVEVGVTLPNGKGTRQWLGLIPNSQVYSSPDPPNDRIDWQILLYVHPSPAAFYVTIVLTCSLAVLGAVILSLHYNESRQDFLEKRQDAHLFSFDAM